MFELIWLKWQTSEKLNRGRGRPQKQLVYISKKYLMFLKAINSNNITPKHLQTWQIYQC